MQYKYYQDIIYEKRADKVFCVLIYLLLIFYLLVFVCSTAFQNSYNYITIRGASMQPTLNADPIYEDGYVFQDTVYVRLTKDIDYGEIIIIDKSIDKDRSSTIIKRVLGFEGDKITIAKLPILQDDGSTRLEYRFIRIKDKPNSTIEILNEDYISGYVKGEYKDGYGAWNSEPAVVDDGDILLDTLILTTEQDFYLDYISDNTSINTTILYEREFYENYLYRYTADVVIENVPYNGEIYAMKFFVIGSNKQDSEPDQIFYMGDNRTGSSDARFTGTEGMDRVVGRIVSIVHDGYSLKNSPWSWLNNIKECLILIWNEIERYFSIIV